MNEPSQQSNSASQTNGKESTKVLEQAQANAAAKVGKLPSSVSESVDRPWKNSANLVCSEHQAKVDARQREIGERERERAIRTAALRANIPKRHLQFDSAGNGQWDAAYAQIRHMLGTGFLIALIGPRGTGKTQLAVEVLKHHLHNAAEPTPLYCTAMDFFISVKGSYHREAGISEQGVLEDYREPSLLIFDEAHERGETDWENRLLNALIDQRYRDMRDTILVSNHGTAEAFGESVGTSIYSRLIETGGVMVCDWGNFRGAPQ